MTRAIMTHTAYRVDLSVNIISHKDGQEYLATLPLVSLTWLILLAWQLSLLVSRAGYELTTMRAAAATLTDTFLTDLAFIQAAVSLTAGQVLNHLALLLMPWPVMVGG